MAHENPPQDGAPAPERPAPRESTRRTAVGCAWWWWVIMLVFLAILIWLWFGWWRAQPPHTPATPGPAPAVSPGEPPPPSPNQLNM
jgi:hypothetical protein